MDAIRNKTPVKSVLFARYDPRVPHSMTLENFRDDGRKCIARPFTVARQVSFGRAHGAVRDDGDMLGRFVRPKRARNVGKDVADQMVGKPSNRTGGFDSARKRDRR